MDLALLGRHRSFRESPFGERDPLTFKNQGKLYEVSLDFSYNFAVFSLAKRLVKRGQPGRCQPSRRIPSRKCSLTRRLKYNFFSPSGVNSQGSFRSRKDCKDGRRLVKESLSPNGDERKDRADGNRKANFPVRYA